MSINETDGGPVTVDGKIQCGGCLAWLEGGLVLCLDGERRCIRCYSAWLERTSGVLGGIERNDDLPIGCLADVCVWLGLEAQRREQAGQVHAAHWLRTALQRVASVDEYDGPGGWELARLDREEDIRSAEGGK